MLFILYKNVIIAMYVICICMSHVCIFVLCFALQIWRIIKYLSIYDSDIKSIVSIDGRGSHVGIV